MNEQSIARAKSRATQGRQEWGRKVYDCRHMDRHSFKRGVCEVCGRKA